MRHEAYERAKEQRASDPRYLAMKEEAKRRRRAASQLAKERRRARAAERKHDQKGTKSGKQQAGRATADARLKQMVRPASELDPNGSRREPR
jgi:hypothetical protein